MAIRCSGLSPKWDYSHREEETGMWAVHRDAAGEPIMVPCNAYALRGTDPPMCKTHLSKYRGLDLTKVQRRGLRELVEMMDIPDLHPMDALLDAVRYAGAMSRALAVLAEDLVTVPNLVWEDGVPRLEGEAAIWGVDHNHDQAAHIIMQMHASWTDRYIKACKLALDAGVDERIVRNAEATVTKLLEAFQRTLARVPLTDEVRTTLARTLAEEVRVLIDPSIRRDLPQAARLGP